MKILPNACGDDVIFVPAPDPCEGDCNLQIKTATQNGQLFPDEDYDGLRYVNVNVPNSYSASDEGKVVSDGALISQGGLTITENGTYDTTLIAQLIANIEGGGGITGEYELLEYIESDGTQTIDLGVSPFGKTLKAVWNIPTGNTGWKWAFGTSVSNSLKIAGLQLAISDNNKKKLFTGTSTAIYIETINFNRLDCTEVSISPATSLSMYVFNLHEETPDGNDYKSKVKISLIALDDDYFVACRRKSDGVCGLWDCTNSQLLTDVANGNPFTAGDVLLEFGGSSESRDNYIVDPQLLDYYATYFPRSAITGTSNTQVRLFAGITYSAYDARNESLSTETFDGETHNVLLNDMYATSGDSHQNHAWPYKKIPASASKLYVTVSTLVGNDENGSFKLRILDAYGTTNNFGGLVGNALRIVTFGSVAMTISQLNNQTGVSFEIPFTSNTVCSPQTVEIDLSDINVDTYLFMWNVMTRVKIRDIHWE